MMDNNNNDNNNNNNDDEDNDDDDLPIVEIVHRSGDKYNDNDHRDESVRLIIHESVVVIESEAFGRSESIIEVIFHDNVTRIGYRAFSYCTKLRRINSLPEGLIHLGQFSFCGCESLEGRITIPRSVQHIHEWCFMGCDSLESVVFHQLADVELGHTIFLRCKNLRLVTLPSQNLQRIPDHFVEECSSLEEIEVSMSIQEIGWGAFAGCGLRSIHLSENVIFIESFAFEKCFSLTTVTIRSSSSSNLRIGGDIFEGCPSLCAIKVYPWIWPQIFESMNDDPTFIMKFFKRYHNHMIDFQNFGMTDRRRRYQRRLRRRMA